MLFVRLCLGPDRYAIPAREIVETVPFVELKKIPLAPAGVAGVFNYRGRTVPVVDLAMIALGRESAKRLGTRIVLVRMPPRNGKTPVLGVIAENATETLRMEESEFADSGVAAPGAPFLGKVASDANGFLQWLDAPKILPEAVAAALFRDLEE